MNEAADSPPPPEAPAPPQPPALPLRPRGYWAGSVLGFLGLNWGLNFLVPAIAHGFMATPLAFLPLAGFAAFLVEGMPRRWRLAAVWLCVLEAVLITPLLFFGTVSSFMDPRGIIVRAFGMQLFTIWDVGGIMLYFGARGAVFVWAAFVIDWLPAAQDGKKGETRGSARERRGVGGRR